MKYTTNYSLKKPDLTDTIDVANINDNMDIVDGELKARVLTSDVNVVATANKILPLDANAKLPTDITGDSATVAGKTIGNASGNVPLSNGTVNANLNADKVDGYDLNQGVKTTDSPTHVKMTLTQDGTAAPMVVTSGMKVTNLNADKVDGYDLDQGVKTTDSPTHVRLTLSQASGTSPMVVTSPTVVTNLNADKVDGHDLDQDVKVASSPTHVALTLSQADGTTPMTIISKTKVSNLNVDQVDGYDAGNASGNIPLSNSTLNTNLNADKVDGYDAGNANGNVPVSNGTVNTNLNADKVDGYDLNQGVKTTDSPTHVALTLSQANGTTPMTITSKTKVTNLNADQVDGYDVGHVSGNIPLSDGTVNTNLNADKLDGNDATAFATSTQGTKADNALPAVNYTANDVLNKLLTVDGTTSGLDADKLDGMESGNAANNIPVNNGTVNTNLNADKVDGHDLNQDVNTTSSPTHVRLTLSQASGTSPMVVTSPTVVTNLNADKVDGYDAGNASGNIPLSNGTVNAGLNADKVDGHDLDQDVKVASSPTFVRAILSQATGTAPMTVTSTTKVTNLNADMIDDKHVGHVSGNIPLSDGTVNTNLNADKVDGYDLNQSVKTTDSPTHVALTLSQADGIAPMIITSKTKVDNLNADQVDGYNSDDLFTNNMNRQALINGNFDIWQRGTSFIQTDSLFSADRWHNTMTYGDTINISRQEFPLGQTEVPNNPKYFVRKIFTSFSGGWSNLSQRIEDVRSFSGQKVTVSFYARSSVAMTLRVLFQQIFDNTDSVTMDAVEESTSTSWQKYSITFNIPSILGKAIGGNNNYLGLIIQVPSAPNGSYLDIAQVQMNIGGIALPFQPKTFEEELRDCQRYYEKSYNTDTTPGSPDEKGLVHYNTGYSSGGQKGLPVSFKVAKRVTPILIIYSKEGYPNKISPLDVQGSPQTTIYSSTAYIGTEGFLVYTMTDVMMSGFCFHWIVDAEI